MNPIPRIRHRLSTEHFGSTVVVPGPLVRAGPLAAWLLDNVRALAERICVPPVVVKGWHAAADPDETVGAGHRWLERKTCLVVNVRFLLMHAPPAWPLLERASQGSLVLYGNRGSGELQAFAFRAS